MPSDIVAQIETFRGQLARLNASQAVRMAQAWNVATAGLVSEYEGIAQQMADRRARGLPTSLWHLQRMERYQTLLEQVSARQKELEPAVVEEISTAQAAMGRLGLLHSQTVLDQMAPGIVGQFDRLPYSAVANMVGSTGAGTPLGRLLHDSWAGNAGVVADALVKGTALGWHPSKTAAAMRDATNMNLTRAIVIARTEQNRVYRTATQMQYRTGGVAGYRRHADKGPRTCMACLLQDGEWYAITVEFEEHVQGRCAMIPAFGNEPVSWETGEQWFMRQDAETQQRMMGPGRYAAWREDQFDIHAMQKHVIDRTWGNSWQVRSLKELTGGDYAVSIKPPPAPPPVKSGPVGTPISQALKVGKGKLAAAIRTTINAIDAVHGDGTLAELPVKQGKMTGRYGHYKYAPHPNGNRPLEIKLSTIEGNHAMNTMAHEVGHWLDDQQLHVTKGRTLANMTPEVQAWRDALAQSKAVKTLDEWVTKGHTMMLTDSAGKTYSRPMDASYIRYNLRYDELWARSYSQYIATRSGDAAMLAELSKVRDSAYYSTQWEDADFAPIAAAIDGILKAAGWLQ